MNRYLALIVLILFPYMAHAQTYHAVQGDVLALDFATQEKSVQLICFGKKWPVKRISATHVRGWIGIDLKKANTAYNIEWKTKSGSSNDLLFIKKGEFRISRITVKKNMSSFDAPTLKRVLANQKTLKSTYQMHVDASPSIVMERFPVTGITSTPFGAQRYVNGTAKSPHSGIDIAAPEGTNILAPLAGKILLVEDMYLNGNLIAVGHGSGLVSVYAHLKQVNVTAGQWVKAGDILGEVGSTGRSTGPHLHWGVRFNGARINPQSIIVHK
ncbi:MAG: M23 family metallopeptidase [Mariprofundaceae bacterium]